ncbi:MAG: hypothetical protein MZU91_12175 [Desulfosudis oleivorans]|nr:hypothetical protein [Desulfosudis oleivorans]
MDWLIDQQIPFTAGRPQREARAGDDGRSASCASSPPPTRSSRPSTTSRRW